MPDHFIKYYTSTLDYFKTNKWLLLIILGTNVGQGVVHYTPEPIAKTGCACVQYIKQHVEDDH